MQLQLSGKNQYLPALVGSTLLAVMVSGCSSSNNAGAGGGDDGGTTPDPATRFSSVLEESAGAVSQSRIAEVAELTEASGDAGIVVQSSKSTIDDIVVDAEYNDDGTITYTVRSTAGDWTINSGGGEEDPGEGVTVLARAKGEGWNAISLLLETDAGKRWVDLYTDIETGETPDTDYLSGGIWVFVPKTTTALADYEFGVFVHGSDQFDNDNLAGLTGTARYEGDAAGLYSDPDAGSNAFFSAMSELTANFDDSGAGSETISGRIHSFMIGGKDVMDLELMLGEANLTDAAPPGTGLFTGTTSATYDESDFAGNWGGRFYGNGAQDSDQPGSVAGTFGAADDDDRSFIGVFGAHRQDDN